MDSMRHLEGRPRFSGQWPSADDGWVMLDCWDNAVFYAAEYLNKDTGMMILCVTKYQSCVDGERVCYLDSRGADIPWPVLCAVAHDVMGYGVGLTEEVPSSPVLPYRCLLVEFEETTGRPAPEALVADRACPGERLCPEAGRSVV